ncbi:oxaloacetate decarboxylase gamma chain [BD1-7 clade bacterium]|uniref:Probable oxaloacetate decarboxylase gamma chain n=1 Tax=BD1-7 clade bacterium TaxID=2029982 RepID=A0A5S9QZP2_9GAMM|nr:oxaloacetate decarboxylase gamma chain [BD1-7 clade bacterium]CAA0106405.1 oxaloacetate decarboxylase gamma chain [BD1-7 clade bacterium]CAA0125895.1 oxaloacetate decarboxylase gamma chain [BD1-7 clade bacterium]
MQDNLLEQGAELMIFGMGTVFVFLAVLVVVTMTLSTVVQKFFPEAPKPAAVPTTPRPNAATNDDQLVAVITAAVHKHRTRQK